VSISFFSIRETLKLGFDTHLENLDLVYSHGGMQNVSAVRFTQVEKKSMCMNSGRYLGLKWLLPRLNRVAP